MNGGLLSFTQGIRDVKSYEHFLMGLSFLVGFGSELFIKRLITICASLFGEKSTLDGPDFGPEENQKNEPEAKH